MLLILLQASLGSRRFWLLARQPPAAPSRRASAPAGVQVAPILSHLLASTARFFLLLCCLPEIGKAFVNHYYSTFPHATRANLQTLFNDQSLLTWEGNPSQQFMGMTNIMTHLVVRAARHSSPACP